MRCVSLTAGLRKRSSPFQQRLRRSSDGADHIDCEVKR